MDYLNTNYDYLGDGLYVSYDGVGFTLRAPRGLTPQDDHWVYLEPEVLQEFLRYIEQHRKDN